jgi:Ran GTPase-activating protein (RanGAP) involved in mRNA processing and transport
MIRCGYTVGRTTQEASLGDQLRRFKPRALREESQIIPKYANPAKESLMSKCIAVIVDNFDRRPVKESIPPLQMAAITKALPVTLSPIIGAKHVYNENYWKRCCVEKYGWHNCNLHEHGFLWKQMFFEKYMQERLEDFDPETESIDELYEFADAAMDYIFTITFRQLPSHLDLFELCSLFPNLTRLDICYGINKIGMQYERMLFGMKISDATALAKTFDSTDTLTTLALSSNLIDDDLLRMLMTGLIKNNTITYLDVSHNKITNHGARLLSKLLGENSVLTTMDLSDNQIHAEGGRYLARGLRENDSLLQLNLRLNRLTDGGCRMLLEGLQDNVTLTDLNLASNGMGSQAAQILATIVRDPEHRMNTLTLTGNELTADNMEILRVSMRTNSSLVSMDLRDNPGYEAEGEAIKEIDARIYKNEIKIRRAGGHP